MNVSDKIDEMLEDSGKFPTETEIEAETGSSSGLYTVTLRFPPTVEPDDRSEWIQSVVGRVEDVLELAITRSVITAEGEGVRTRIVGDELRFEAPTGPIVQLDILGVLLDDG